MVGAGRFYTGGDVSDPQCGTCRFWEPDVVDGECRRRAPLLTVGLLPSFVARTPHDEISYAREGEAVWPRTLKEDWCGEWECRQPEASS
jgi:hypothetical protein